MPVCGDVLFVAFMFGSGCDKPPTRHDMNIKQKISCLHEAPSSCSSPP